MCTMIMAMLFGLADCLPPDPRPTYDQLWTLYGPYPDCLNQSRHVKYLTQLKTLPMRTGDRVTEQEYNASVDLYIERMEWYCRNR